MLIIPTVMAMRVPGIHFGNPSWAVKAGAPQGRNVHDISYCEAPEHIYYRPSVLDAGTPYAFNVISRTLDVITDHTIEGAGIWYVDDLNACSNRRTVESDMSRVDDEVRTLLGPVSVVAEKDKSGRQLASIWMRN